MVKSSCYIPNKKLFASVMASHTRIVRPVQYFALDATSEFASRSSDVFSSLSTLENKHETWMSVNSTLESFEEHIVLDPIQPEQEVFKKPLAPLPLKRKPFFKKNMKKWIRYSLTDVPLSSDATNKAVAFQFLRDLRKKKESSEHKDCSDEKVKFCQPVKGKECIKKGEKGAFSTLVSRSSVENSSRAVSTTLSKGKKETSITLGHLDDDFEEN